MGAKMCHAKSQTSGERIDYLPPKKDANRACTFSEKVVPLHCDLGGELSGRLLNED